MDCGNEHLSAACSGMCWYLVLKTALSDDCGNLQIIALRICLTMSLEKIPWYYKIISFQNNHTLIIYIIMSGITSSLKKIQFLYIFNSWIWAQITAGKYYLQLSFFIAFQLEVFYFNFFGMNKTKIYVCSGYVSVLPVTQSGRKKGRIFLEEKSQQFQFKSIKYSLQFKHGIHLIQWLLAVWAPTLELVILDLVCNKLSEPNNFKTQKSKPFKISTLGRN